MGTGMNTSDILICGGGMVGASLGIALSGHGLSVTVLEQSPPRTPNPPSYDDRTLALNWATCNILKSLGVWAHIPQASPIRRVHTREEGRFGSVLLDAHEQGFESFGHVVFARDLGQALMRRLGECVDVTLLQPASLQGLVQGDDGVQVEIEQDGTTTRMRAPLLVAADGSHSQVRRLLQIPVEEEDYGQVAIISNVSTEQPHQGTAWECLSPQGPFALLPLTDQRCGVVWSVPAEEQQFWLEMEDADFLARLQQRFGYRLGRFTRVGRRASYPLKRVMPQETVWHRTVLIGNAAHAVHPLSAQGFNLGIRDVAGLAQTLLQARREQGESWDPGHPSLLETYRARRLPDQQRILRWTDGMVRLYRQSLPPLALARQLGLNLIGHVPALQRGILATTMGLLEQDNPLVRGEAL